MYLILDTETTGLPDKSGLPYGSYPDYRNISKYDNARIVQFTYMLCDKDFQQIDLKDFIIKSDGFKIENSKFHRITNEISENIGVLFQEVATEFQEHLKDVTHILAHNLEFDINVIKSELYRYGLHLIIEDIDKKHLICTMKKTIKAVNIQNRYGLKYPTLAELYYYACGESLENAHNAKYDVINLHKICTKMPKDIFGL